MGIEVKRAVLVARSQASQMRESVDFYVNAQLVSSSLIPRKNSKKISVPVGILEDEIKRRNANFLFCDIEGTEVDIFPSAELEPIHTILMKEHGCKVGEDRIEQMKADLAAAGLEEGLEFRRGHVGVYSWR